MALRIAILGVVVLATFAVLFLRLWALQVLSGADYLNAAENNQLRTVRVPAPRGAILDRHGAVLVGNVAGRSVQIWPADLPTEGHGRDRVLKRLASILHVKVYWLIRQVEKRAGDPLTPVTVKRGIHDYQVNYLEERATEFQGVHVVDSYLRDYPHRALAAHLLGHVGEVSDTQVAENSQLVAGDEVGQGGVEATYDRFLRGVPGEAQLRVDSRGQPQSSFIPTEQAQPGNALRLTIDLRLQQRAEAALQYGIRLARANEAYAANGGAIVAMDPRNGEVLALASNPTYKPSVFVGRGDPEKLAPLLNERVAEEQNFRGLNRALSGLYPPGSTFKPVTALAAMEERLVGRWDYLPCTGSFSSHGQRFDNWTPYVNEGMTLPTAIAQSCDTYFYRLGLRFWELPPERGHPLQAWASRFGFGAPTGIDVGPEAEGLLPTPEWRRQTFTPDRYPDTWQIDRLWKPGDSIQLAIGQKDLLVTPIQMARFYSMIANGARLVTPHVGYQIEQPGQNGASPNILRRFTPPQSQPVDVDPYALDAVREGLLEATHYPNGTAAAVFDSFDVEIAGKTGTAEKVVNGRLEDQSWWCGYGPYDAPEIVVCAMIENGGHGGTAAAPAARMVFERYFGVKGDPIGQVISD
jgi:penicillin-binding protein 2